MKQTIIVAGLGRCGTSLVMQMLDAVGIETTGEHPSFEDIGILREMERDSSVAEGKAVKLLDPHLHEIDLHGFKVIFLSRNVREQAKSISKFGHYMAGVAVEAGRRGPWLKRTLPTPFALSARMSWSTSFSRTSASGIARDRPFGACDSSSGSRSARRLSS